MPPLRLLLAIPVTLLATACAGAPPPPPPQDAGPYPEDYKEIIWAAITTPHWRIASVTIRKAEITRPVRGALVRQRMELFTRVTEPTGYVGWIVCKRVRIDSGLLINHEWPVLGHMINRGKIIATAFSDACTSQPFEPWPEIEGKTFR